MLINKVEIDTVSIKPVLIKKVGFDLNTPSVLHSFTPNYNGINSYIEIPEWKPEGEFEIECDIYLSAKSGFRRWLNNSEFNSSGKFLFYNASNVVKYVDGEINTGQPVIDGFHKIKVTGTLNKPITVIGAQTNTGVNAFKGQISNLKLIDKVNPENSRFYSGIVYSYVDPDATEVPMPDSTVLVDEWCVEKVVHTLTGSFTTSGTYGSNVLVRPHATFKIEVEGTGDVDNVRVGIDTCLSATTARTVTTTNSAWVRNYPLRLAIPHGTTVTKVLLRGLAHGKLVNFGTAQPYVPLLGDREEYCGNKTGSTWIRGLRPPDGSKAVMHSQGNPPSSFLDDVINKIPQDSILESKGEFILSVEYNKYATYLSSYSEAIQHAFQYPNTFKVIKPTDPDYNILADE